MKIENFKKYGSSHADRDVPQLFLKIGKILKKDKWRSSFFNKVTD